MTQNKNRKKKRKHSIILTAAAILLVCYFVVAFLNLRDDVARSDRSLADLKVQVTQQDEENKELRRQLERENEDEVIERIAREELDFAYPNEKIYIERPGGVE